MMISLIWDAAFIRILKKWKKKHPHLIKTFQEVLSEFVKNPFQPSLRTHCLSGKLKDCWACSITYEYRVVFKFISKNKVLLIDIGTHDEVY